MNQVGPLHSRGGNRKLQVRVTATSSRGLWGSNWEQSFGEQICSSGWWWREQVPCHLQVLKSRVSELQWQRQEWVFLPAAVSEVSESSLAGAAFSWGLPDLLRISLALIGCMSSLYSTNKGRAIKKLASVLVAMTAFAGGSGLYFICVVLWGFSLSKSRPFLQLFCSFICWFVFCDCFVLKSPSQPFHLKPGFPSSQVGSSTPGNLPATITRNLISPFFAQGRPERDTPGAA